MGAGAAARSIGAFPIDLWGSEWWYWRHLQGDDAIQAAVYQAIYSILKPLLFLLRRIFPNHVLTTEEIGQAMLIVARRGYPKHILEIRDIRAALQTS